MQQPGAPSVEEILEAIKVVIARDNRAAGPNARGSDSRGSDSRAPRTSSARGQDDVLDLGVLEGFSDAGDDSDAGTAADAAHTAESLITPEARHSMRESLAALTMLSEPRAQPQIVRSGETSLEGMVRDMLRPALTEWLDRNLPAMVERLVAAEIARIVGKKG